MKFKLNNNGKYTIIADDGTHYSNKKSGKDIEISKNFVSKLQPISELLLTAQEDEMNYEFNSENEIYDYNKINIYKTYDEIMYYRYHHKHIKFNKEDAPYIPKYPEAINIASFLYKHEIVLNLKDWYVANRDLGVVSNGDHIYPDVPIYFKECYTSNLPNNYTTYKEKIANDKISVLKYKFNDITKNKVFTHKQYYKYLKEIETDLIKVLSPEHRIDIVVNPDDTTNTLKRIIKDICSKYKNITESHDFHDAEAIIIIGDTINSKKSFVSLDYQCSKYNMPIYNLAYGNKVIDYYSTKTGNTRSKSNLSKPVKGLIFDVDNTLMHFKHPVLNRTHQELYGSYELPDSVIDKKYIKSDIMDITDYLIYLGALPVTKYVSYMQNIIESMPLKYGKDTFLFLFINYLINHNIKVAIVSNLGVKKLAMVIYGELRYVPYKVAKNIMNNVIITSATKLANNKHALKPSPYWIHQAINKMGLTTNDHIIGVGNQSQDIMAYNKAGIDSVIVTWFNMNNYDINSKEYPIPLSLSTGGTMSSIKDINVRNLKIFNNMHKFISWIIKQSPELKRHPFKCNSDPRKKKAAKEKRESKKLDAYIKKYKKLPPDDLPF